MQNENPSAPDTLPPRIGQIRYLGAALLQNEETADKPVPVAIFEMSTTDKGRIVSGRFSQSHDEGQDFAASVAGMPAPERAGNLQAFEAGHRDLEAALYGRLDLGAPIASIDDFQPKAAMPQPVNTAPSSVRPGPG